MPAVTKNTSRNPKPIIQMVTLACGLFFVTSAQATHPLTSTAGRVGPPVDYGLWSITNTSGEAVVNDSSPCATDPNWTCLDIAKEDGFLYQQITTPDNETYMRTVLVDPGVGSGDATTLPFSNETYTPMKTKGVNTAGDWILGTSNPSTLGLAGQGLAARQIMRDNANGFETTVELQNGFARAVMGTNDGFSSPDDPIYHWCETTNPGDPAAAATCAQDLAEKAWSVKIEQFVTDRTNPAENLFDSEFSLINYNEINTAGAGTGGLQTAQLRGQLIDIAQGVTDVPSGEKQKFDLRNRWGRVGYEWSCGGFFVTCEPYNLTDGDGGNPLVLDTMNVTWNATDRIKALWMGSDMGGGLTNGEFILTSASVNDGAPVRELSLDTPPVAPPSSWPSSPFADLNWAVDTANVDDPFAAPPNSMEAMPRTVPPTF